MSQNCCFEIAGLLNFGWFKPRNLVLFIFEAANSTRLPKTVVDRPQKFLHVVPTSLYSLLAELFQINIGLGFVTGFDQWDTSKGYTSRDLKNFLSRIVGTLLPWKQAQAVLVGSENHMTQLPTIAQLRSSQLPEVELPKGLAADHRHMKKSRRKTNYSAEHVSNG